MLPHPQVFLFFPQIDLTVWYGLSNALSARDRKPTGIMAVGHAEGDASNEEERESVDEGLKGTFLSTRR